MRRSLVVASVILIAASPSPQGSGKRCDPNQHPFQVPAERVRSEIAHIVLLPVENAAGLSPKLDNRIETLDSMLQSALTGSGFQLVAPQNADSLWAAILPTLGPIYDQFTGQANEPRLDSVRALYRQALHEQFQADAYLYPALVTREAEITTATQAEWDGVEQFHTKFGAAVVDAFLQTSYTGPTTGMSLEVVIESLAGVELYRAYGGLQLLMVPKYGVLVPVPDADLLTDRRKMAKAVVVALCELRKQRQQ